MTSHHHLSSALVWPENTEGHRIPFQAFTDQGLYDLEQEKIFRGDHWCYVGLEAELPKPGDFKTTYIGDTPVVVTRGKEGEVNVMVNRCAHRGAMVCREASGNAASLTCVYHQWSYDLNGKLLGVPFRRGMRGKGGMPGSFEPQDHGLERLRVETINGLIFATFSEQVGPLRAYLGPELIEFFERMFSRPVEVLGDEHQYIHGNWKLYNENTRDPYHASLLHLFHNTFGLYRATQTGSCIMDSTHRHSMTWSAPGGASKQETADANKDSRTFNTNFKLQDMSLLESQQEFADGHTVYITSVFPNLIVQQIANTLCVRHIQTKGPAAFELVWTFFGYADDSEEMKKRRLKQANLVGPAGLVSMEDSEALRLVQEGVVRSADKTSYIAMGGGRAENTDHLVTEAPIIGFWEGYERALGIERRASNVR
jgi:anthranilate 1,2-dioxygenase large subunit